MDLTHGSIGYRSKEGNAEHAGFYLTPKPDDFNQELQVCIAEALYDVDSIVADPGAYAREQLATLHSQIVSNLERAWELSGGSEDQRA